ncbi:protein TTE1956-like X2 [Biomphalaria pfeifferi]|uniref:Protein TTE1956-like X2 n=1 Tax=Biomphalaria pfeifferi TaxID=112525 RepID=A0AAD8BBM4_BIOPF|nr:protein TTE1956-like X2 [Biomphalaria pfeifferi]
MEVMAVAEHEPDDHEETIKATKQFVYITRSSKQKSSKIATFFFKYRYLIDKNDLCMHSRKPAQEAAAWKSKYDRSTDVIIMNENAFFIFVCVIIFVFCVGLLFCE